MELNSTQKNILPVLNAYFLRPFSISISVIFFIIYIFKFSVNYVSSNQTLYISLMFGFITFFVWFVSLPQKNITKEVITRLSVPLFLMSLFLISILSLEQWVTFNISQNINLILVGVAIISGSIVFYVNREYVAKKINEEHDEEIKNEQKRYEEFPKRFLLLSKIPFVNFIFRQIFREGLISFLVLISILSFFIALRAPYLNLSFTGAHDMKYSSYVEFSKHMLENDLLWNQAKYQADPTTLSDGKFDTFGHYPIMEWGIVAVNKVFPGFSLEFNTRLFMTFLGVILLLLIYAVSKKFIPKTQALLVLFLLSTNVVFQFFTYVTVLDPINLIFLFLSLIFLIRGLDESSPKKLLVAGILAGIGISIKYHALIFYTPIFLLFFYLYKKIDEPRRVAFMLIVFPSFILQTILFRISFRHLPQNFILYFSIFILLIFAHIYLYRNVDKISSFFENFFVKRISLFYSVLAAFLVTLISLIFSISWVQSLFKDFVTDQHLIFNWNMYETFLNRYRDWLTAPLYYFSLFLIIPALYIKSRGPRILLIALLFSSLVYFILTSKVLYFHEYYHHIIIITFTLLFSFTYLITKFYKNKFSKIFIHLILITLLGTISYQSVSQVNARLSQEKPEIKLVSKYLNEHLKEDQFFIYSTDISTSITFYSDRLSLFETLATDYNKETVKLIKEDLRQGNTFGSVMREYGIWLYVTKTTPTAKNNDFSYLFSPETLAGSIYELPERTALVLCKENSQCENNMRFLPEVGYEIFEQKVRPYLHLVQEINGYYIYAIE